MIFNRCFFLYRYTAFDAVSSTNLSLQITKRTLPNLPKEAKRLSNLIAAKLPSGRQLNP